MFNTKALDCNVSLTCMSKLDTQGTDDRTVLLVTKGGEVTTRDAYH